MLRVPADRGRKTRRYCVAPASRRLSRGLALSLPKGHLALAARSGATGLTYPRRLKYCTARSRSLAALRVVKVPRFRRLPVLAFFLREYNRYSPDFNFRIIRTSPLAFDVGGSTPGQGRLILLCPVILVWRHSLSLRIIKSPGIVEVLSTSFEAGARCRQ